MWAACGYDLKPILRRTYNVDDDIVPTTYSFTCPRGTCASTIQLGFIWPALKGNHNWASDVAGGGVVALRPWTGHTALGL